MKYPECEACIKKDEIISKLYEAVEELQLKFAFAAEMSGLSHEKIQETLISSDEALALAEGRS